MSGNPEGSAAGGHSGEKSVQHITVQKASTFPIDLAQAKIAHIKPTGEPLKVSAVQGSTQQATATYRTISTGQPSQVRVVVPSAAIMSQSLLPKLEGNAVTQSVRRSLSQTSITVTRPLTQATFLPRAAATNIPTQRLVTPIRTPTPPAAVANLAVSNVRGTNVARSSASPSTSVVPPTTATWMASSGSSMQFIRGIIPQRQKIVSAAAGNGSVVAVGQGTTIAANQQQPLQSQAHIQSTTSPQVAQQSFVATLSTVLQPRQQTATLVYTNVSSSQGQHYNVAGSTQQRYAVATATIGNSQRQGRPMQFNRALSSSKIVLTPTLTSGASVANLQARTTTGNVNLTTGSLPATRIIQLQQQPGTSGQQLIGSSRIPNNLMLQPIIMSSGGGKIGIRPSSTIPAKVQPSLTITQLGLGKLATGQSAPTSSLTTTNLQGPIVTSSSTTISNSVLGNCTQLQQLHPGTQQSTQHNPVQTLAHSQSQQCVPAPQQQINQMINISQPSAQGLVQNVNIAPANIVPIAISSRGANILTGTITPIKTATASTISIPPIAKVVPQQHHGQNQNLHVTNPTAGGNQTSDGISSSQHHQTTSVFIHARPPTSGNASNPSIIPSTFAQQPTNYYYESVPANSITVSTGVLSLTTTTVTSSITTLQAVTSSSLGSGPASSAGYNPTSSFTVVPTTRTQAQTPGSTAGSQTQNISQIQGIPLRFNSQHIQDQSASTSGQQSGTVAQYPTSQSHQQPHSQIFGVTQSQHHHPAQAQQQPHMLFPASIKLPVTAVVGASTPRIATTVGQTSALSSTFLRKRDSDGSPIRAVKNLAPTFLSMSSSQVANMVVEQVKEREGERPASPQSRPGSSSGSTTVSANSSPGVDQQMSEEANSLVPMNVLNESLFSPINEKSYLTEEQHIHRSGTPNVSSNGKVESTTQKKLGRSTDNPPTALHQESLAQQQKNTQIVEGSTVAAPGQQNSNSKKTTNATNMTICNKENTKPTEFIIKKPRTCNLLDGYKQNWKAAHNHFQRYSDVKPRDERHPTVMDLANQSHVVQKINGWKIYHLSAQMEDLCEIESQVFEKLSNMLKQLECQSHDADIDRVNDLIKGNMQRSKIIMDGVNEARSQIMKIFDHKANVSDIIHRCASKRNFKKREKP